MSLCIDIEKFPNMSAVLKEVERQRNLRIFSAIAPDQTNIHKPLTRTMSTSDRRHLTSTKMLNARPVIRATAGVTVFQALLVQPSITGNQSLMAASPLLLRNWAKRSFVCWKKTFLSQWTFFSFYARYERRLWVVTSYFSKSAVVGYKCWRLIKKLLILAGRCTVKTTIKTWYFQSFMAFLCPHVVSMTARSLYDHRNVQYCKSERKRKDYKITMLPNGRK